MEYVLPSSGVTDGITMGKARAFVDRSPPRTETRSVLRMGHPARNEHSACHEGELDLQPGLHVLRGHSRPRLQCLEHAHRPALDHHVLRPTGLGSRVLIDETWNKAPILPLMLRTPPAGAQSG